MTDTPYASEDALRSTQSPRFVPGSVEHCDATARLLLDTFDPYRPSILAWPRLSVDALNRLRNLPFWDVAVETEGFASSRMQAFADTLRDPRFKEAIALNAFEEGRHKIVIRNMLNFYGIVLKPEGTYPPSRYPLWMFLRTGYGECFDSFFAFGLFKMARDSGFFPSEFVEVFEPIIQEEARHILFFVNWIACHAAQQKLLQRFGFRLLCWTALVLAALGRLSLAGRANHGQDNDNFVVAGGKTLTQNLTPRRLIDIALAEDERRMQRYDQRLLRPTIMPFLGRLALRFLTKD